MKGGAVGDKGGEVCWRGEVVGWGWCAGEDGEAHASGTFQEAAASGGGDAVSQGDFSIFQEELAGGRGGLGRVNCCGG